MMAHDIKERDLNEWDMNEWISSEGGMNEFTPFIHVIWMTRKLWFVATPPPTRELIGVPIGKLPRPMESLGIRKNSFDPIANGASLIQSCTKAANLRDEAAGAPQDDIAGTHYGFLDRRHTEIKGIHCK